MSTLLRGKHVGVAPRPRVALINLADKEEKALTDFFPTVYTAQRISDLPEIASPVELDLIVSSAVGDDTPRFLSEYAECHLILLGSHAWAPWGAPSPRPAPGSRYFCSCSATSRSMQYAISEDLDPRLHAAAVAALPLSALGIPVISYTDGFQSAVDPCKEGWIAWALHPETPIAVSIYRDGFHKGLAWFPDRPANCAALVKALCGTWAQRDRDSFPMIVEWADSSEWRTHEERSILAERALLVERLEQMKSSFKTKLDDIDSRFAMAKDSADAGPRALLTTQDEALVDAVKSVFEDLGFQVTNVDDGRPLNLAKREDLQLRLPKDPASWVALVEVKGHKKRGAAAEDLTKIERHVRNFLKEEGRMPSLKVYVCNSQFGLPPDERQIPYAASTFAEDFAKDPDVPGIIIATPDLFRLHRDRIQIGLEQARQLLLDARGVFAYP
jgi:hypothetical protein